MADDDAVRQLLLAAAREFNVGRYFEAHEVLEDGLDAVPDALWELIIGLIQVAVGYHKATIRRWRGAAQMLDRALDKIERYPADAGGLNLEVLRRRVRADVPALHRGRFDLDAFARHPPRLQPKHRQNPSTMR